MQVNTPAKKVGTVTLAIGGIVATMTADTAREWLELMSQYAPLILSGWLLYSLYHAEQDNKKSREEIKRLNAELSDIKQKLLKMEVLSARDLDDGR